MTVGPAFSPELVGSFGLFFGFAIGSSIWTIRCPTSSTADHLKVAMSAAIQPQSGLTAHAAALQTQRAYQRRDMPGCTAPRSASYRHWLVMTRPYYR